MEEEDDSNNIVTKITDLLQKEPVFDTTKHIQNYVSLKEQIEQNRKLFKQNYASHNKDSILQEAKKYFFRTLTDSIFHYWYETPWDFNGHTQEPKNGQIACGYFITTSVQDMGFRLQRIRLAQQPASEIIKALCDPA